MSSTINTVAVAGGSGGLGSYIVKELVAAGFKVTVLRRVGSSSTVPAGVAVKDVDYSSLDSLKAAVEGQDAVVSVIATAASSAQKLLVDAAVAAGAKRFIPSEFGINTRAAIGEPIGKIIAGKIAIVDYLIDKARENPSFSWTGISTGLFYDSALEKGFSGFDPATKKAKIFDSGNTPFQASSRPFIGRVVAAVLRKPEQTANKYLLVASFQPTQNEILRVLEELTGGEAWTVAERVDTAALQAEGVKKLAGGNFSAFPLLLERWVYADEAPHPIAVGEDAGELLGLPKEDLRETLRSWLRKVGAI